LDEPELVKSVHRDFIKAGADVIETNSFTANRFKLREADPAEVTYRAAVLAREAAGDRFVLGAIGPCGKPLAPLGNIEIQMAEEQFRVQAEALKAGGVDGIILESFTDLDELEAAAKVVKAAYSGPLVACKSFIEDGETLSEGFPLRAANRMIEMGFDVIGANCVVGPQRMFDIIRWMAEADDALICALPTPGMPQLLKGAYVYDVVPEYFGKAAARLAEAGANMIGGCCGTTPEFIAALRDALTDRKPRARKSVKVAQKAAGKVVEQSDPSELSRKLGKKFVSTVELDLPRGLDCSKVLEGARELKQRGVDLIDISDGARARLRMTPSAICSIIQREAGIETMMHVACRDRNLLALQADMLGAHALGIRNVLAITGDPANIGDFPSATSVFDIDAIGLVRVLSRFNEGRDLAGNSVGKKCAFTIGVAFNPAAPDRGFELERLRRKVDAGAHVIYTQPLFEMAHAEFACAQAAGFGLPILIGVMPLRSQRHAEFMHNEVPGISVPAWLMQKFASLGNEDALKLGVAVAQEFAACLPKMAQGIYLMPPAGNWRIADQVLEAVRQ
jgi:homocysteine S-methyltransferase